MLSRAWKLVAAGATALAAALAIWVVPAFSGGNAGEWTWVSGSVFSDNEIGSAVLTVYNGSSSPQSVTVRAATMNGTADAPSSPTTATIAPGETRNWSWDCGSGFGCQRFYELRTQSPDVVPTLIYDEIDTANLGYGGLIPPGGFQVFGPDQSSSAATTRAISAATAALQAETAALQSKTDAIRGVTDELKSDTAGLQGATAQLQGDTTQLRKDTKKLRKQLKKVLKAVR